MNRIKEPRIVLIGGGTGSFTLLNDLKHYTSNITALVNMADDGGSTGVLRDQLGVLPPGDVRQCLVALSDSSEAVRQIFNYRFPAGSDFSGHSVGNIFLSGLELMTENFSEAVKLASEVLQIKGRVIPVTLNNRKLIVEMPDGARIIGQYAAETYQATNIMGAKVYYDKPARLNPEAKAAIENADLIVLAPGNLYASLIPTLVVTGMPAALTASRAKLVYVCNLVNKSRHTVGFTVRDYVSELERYLGKRRLDTVLYNTDKPSRLTLKAYALEGEYPILFDTSKPLACEVIGGRFLSRKKLKRDKNDRFILRSLIRHDGEAISRNLMSLL